MAKVIDVIQGLLLFVAVDPASANQHHIGAEHDEIYAGWELDPSRFSPEQLQVLDQAGWEWEPEVGTWRRWV